MEKNILDAIKYEFLDQLKTQKNYSSKTIESYNHDINKFYLYLKENDVNSLNMIDKNVLRMYLLKQKENNISNRTISRYYSSLNSFFKHCIEREYIKDNPLELIDYPKYTKKIPDYIYESKIIELLNTNTSDNIEIEIRNKLIISLLLDTGVRVSELVDIRINNINYEERIIKVLGKGNKERFVFFTSKTLEILNGYLSIRNSKALVDNLLINYKGEKLSVRYIQKLVKEIGEKIGLDIHPHLLRHTFATDLLNHGLDIRLIQELLGHENLDTTQIYTHVSNSKVKEVYDNTHSKKN